ncbi:MAG: hypothetical protein ACE14L_13975 [Terriglobales bacterium]
MRYRVAKAIAEMTDSPIKTGVASAIVGVCAALLEYGVHRVAQGLGSTSGVHIAIDVGAIGISVGLLIWFLLSATHARRRRVLQHVRNVAELNHQVRNALQVIVCSQHKADPAHSAMIMESVQRIDRTLRELFPIIGDRAEDIGTDSEADEVMRDIVEERRKAR